VLVTVVTPALAVPAKHWPRVATKGTLKMDPVHWGRTAGGEGGVLDDDMCLRVMLSECHAQGVSLPVAGPPRSTGSPSCSRWLAG